MVVWGPMVSLKNAHPSSLIMIDDIMCRNLYVYTYRYIISQLMKEEAIAVKGDGSEYMGWGRKEKNNLLKLKTSFVLEK